MGRQSIHLVIAITTAILVTAGCSQAAPAPSPTQAPAAPAKAAEATKAPAAAPAPTSAPAAAPAPTSAPAAVPTLSKSYRLTVGTGGTAGTAYPYTGSLSGVWNKYLKGVTVTVETSGGAVENVRLVDSKQTDMGLIQNDVAGYAWEGIEFFKQPIRSLRIIGLMYPEHLHWPVVKATGVKTIFDLKGKRFSVGAPGSGTEVNTRQAFEGAGMSYSDLAKKSDLAYNESVSAMKDRQLDGFSVTSGYPMSAITDITTAIDINIIGISGEVADKVMKKYKGFDMGIVPAKTYKGQDEDIKTMLEMQALIGREEMDADLVYWLARTMMEHQPEVAIGHAKGKDLTRETVAKNPGVPFHPGAERYYKEVGILK